MAWKSGGPAAVHHTRRRSGGHTPLAPLRQQQAAEPDAGAPQRDAYGRKILGTAAGKVEATGEVDPLEALRGQWKPFDHWRRRQEAEQAEMAWLSSARATPDFDLDLTSQPGPLSYEPMVPPRRAAETPPQTPGTPETFQQGGIGQGARRDPRRGQRRQARWTAGDAAPKPTAGDWHRKMEEELRREEERAAQEEHEERERREAEAEAAAKEWADLEAAAREAAEAARAARARADPFSQYQQKQQQQKQQQQKRHWESSAGPNNKQRPASSQQSKEDEFKARAANAERAQQQQRENAARQAKAAAEAAAARKKQQAAEEKRVAEHEGLWQKFERAHDQESSPPTITLASVPVPPPSNPLCLQPGATEDEKKAALRRASLRWHPDKFTGKFGRKIAAGQSEAIHAAVTAVFQSINAQREKIS